MTGPDCVIVAGDFTPWGGMDKANYEFARYVTGTLGKRLTIVAHRVAAPLDTNPLVSWHRVPRPLGMHALGAPILARAGRRFRNRGVLISNFYNTPQPSFRVGCIGAVTPEDMRRAVAAMEATLADMGISRRQAA